MLRILLVVLALLAAPASAAPTQQEVEESLTCQCGCGLTVHSCNHIQCGSGEPIKKEIAERLARGESKEQILAAFTQKFGEKVLSSPTFSGFNWFAWVTPFAALLVAAMVLTLTIRKRAHATADVLAPGRSDRGPPATDALRARLARELDDLERDS
jgi:cytochrome c-type biogenesis protein CcmH/NrfF